MRSNRELASAPPRTRLVCSRGWLGPSVQATARVTSSAMQRAATIVLVCVCHAQSTFGFAGLRHPAALQSTARPRRAFDRHLIPLAVVPAVLPVWAIASGAGLVGAAAGWSSSAAALEAANCEILDLKISLAAEKVNLTESVSQLEDRIF